MRKVCNLSHMDALGSCRIIRPGLQDPDSKCGHNLAQRLVFAALVHAGAGRASAAQNGAATTTPSGGAGVWAHLEEAA